jgi:hypothetical protein
MARPLLALVSDRRFRSVQAAATAALSNIVMEFSPMKTAVLANGGVRILASLLDPVDPDAAMTKAMTPMRTDLVDSDGVSAIDNRVRRYCLCAFKNMVCQAASDLKRMVVMEIGWERLIR